MKTAMQMAIDHYTKLSEQGSNQAYVVAKFLEENFLEVEKQQMKEAQMEHVSDALGFRTLLEKRFDNWFDAKYKSE